MVLLRNTAEICNKVCSKYAVYHGKFSGDDLCSGGDAGSSISSRRGEREREREVNEAQARAQGGCGAGRGLRLCISNHLICIFRDNSGTK